MEQAGIGLGMAASMLWLIRQTSRPFWAELGRLPGTRIYRNVRRYRDAQHHAGVLILRFDAPLHFANKDYFARVLRQRERRFDPRHRRYMPPPPPPHAASAPVHLDAAAAQAEAAQAARAAVGGTEAGAYDGHAEGTGREKPPLRETTKSFSHSRARGYAGRR